MAVYAVWRLLRLYIIKAAGLLSSWCMGQRGQIVNCFCSEGALLCCCPAGASTCCIGWGSMVEFLRVTLFAVTAVSGWCSAASCGGICRPGRLPPTSTQRQGPAMHA